MNSPREMVRAHAYPLLAAISTICLVVIAISLLPVAKQARHFNRCLDAARAQIPAVKGDEKSRVIEAMELCE